MTLFRLEQARPDIAPALFTLSRSFYDLYAAALALQSGRRGMFASFLVRAFIRRPDVTALFLCCVPFWRRAESRATRRGRPHFAALNPGLSSHAQPLAERFDRFRTGRIRKAAARSV